MQYSKLLAIEIDELDTLQDVYQTINYSTDDVQDPPEVKIRIQFHRSVGCLRVVYESLKTKNDFRASFSGWKSMEEY